MHQRRPDEAHIARDDAGGDILPESGCMMKKVFSSAANPRATAMQ